MAAFPHSTPTLPERYALSTTLRRQKGRFKHLSPLNDEGLAEGAISDLKDNGNLFGRSAPVIY
jgi:hypothetical protein